MTLRIIFLFLVTPVILFSQNLDGTNRVNSVVDSSDSNNMVLIQSFEVNVSLDSVWNAYTTEEGWENWAAAKAEIDFKLDGQIKTIYNKQGKIGDESTITLHIINYVPKKMLTLQAELSSNFPKFILEDEKNLYNMILFDELNPQKTLVTSYGIGYRHNDKYLSLMDFFIKGNEQSSLNLIKYLETGKKSINY